MLNHFVLKYAGVFAVIFLTTWPNIKWSILYSIWNKQQSYIDLHQHITSMAHLTIFHSVCYILVTLKRRNQESSSEACCDNDFFYQT